jgi:hypothetical protein
MSGDPAEDAFQRVIATKTSGSYFTGNDARAAAREALKPIRELHQPFVVRTPDKETWHECETCHGNAWPCATARLVYTESELPQ